MIEFCNRPKFYTVSLTAIDIQTIKDMMIDVKQLQFVNKLCVKSQPRVDFSAQQASLGIVIDSFGMQESCHAVLTLQAKCKRDKILIQVRLHACQRGKVRRRIEKGLRPRCLGKLAQICRASIGALCERIRAERHGIAGADLANDDMRIVLRQDALLVPLQFHPRRITNDEVEAAALGEDVDEDELPMEEALAGGDFAGGLREREETVEILEGGVFSEGLDEFVGMGRKLHVAEEVKVHLAFGREVLRREDARCTEEVVVGGKFIHLVERPEPKRAPHVEQHLHAERR